MTTATHTTASPAAEPEGRPAVVQIQALARTFHLLRNCPHVLEWNPSRLDTWGHHGSDAERLAVALVLNVWDRHQAWKCDYFDAVEASKVFDASMWRAFLAWANQPFTV